jgi:predicted dehydrogenase
MNSPAAESGLRRPEFRMRSAIPEQSVRPLRVAIIGAGLMGYWHGRAARHLGSQVVAVVDPDANRARALARACRAAATATDASEVLHGGDLDAVHICSPAWTHGALATQALEAGIHALVEKPMAKSADETRRLIGIAQRKSVILCPVHQVAFQTGTEDAAQALAGLGDPCAIDFRILSDGGTGRSESELDDIVDDILPHPFSVLRRLWPQAAWEPHRWFVTRPRPGHADLAGALKYQTHDARDILERASARETAARTAAGALAKALLTEFGVVVTSRTVAVGSAAAASDEGDDVDALLALPDDAPMRSPRKETVEAMVAAVDEARLRADSVGGCFEVIARGVPPGLGSHVHWDRRLDGRLGSALLSIQAV